VLQVLFAIFTAFSTVLAFPHAQSQETVLRRFQAGFDGFEPRSGVVFDSAGNFYGTTFSGGGSGGAGIVFQMAPPSVPGGSWTETVIHRFSYHSIGLGLSPWGGLAIDKERRSLRHCVARWDLRGVRSRLRALAAGTIRSAMEVSGHP